MECYYCETQDKNVLVKSECWTVMLSEDQRYLGRCTIKCNRHVEDLADLRDEEWLDLGSMVKSVESACRSAFDATMFNIGCQ